MGKTYRLYDQFDDETTDEFPENATQRWVRAGRERRAREAELAAAAKLPELGQMIPRTETETSEKLMGMKASELDPELAQMRGPKSNPLDKFVPKPAQESGEMIPRTEKTPDAKLMGMKASELDPELAQLKGPPSAAVPPVEERVVKAAPGANDYLKAEGAPGYAEGLEGFARPQEELRVAPQTRVIEAYGDLEPKPEVSEAPQFKVTKLDVPAQTPVEKPSKIDAIMAEFRRSVSSDKVSNNFDRASEFMRAGFTRSQPNAGLIPDVKPFAEFLQGVQVKKALQDQDLKAQANDPNSEVSKRARALFASIPGVGEKMVRLMGKNFDRIPASQLPQADKFIDDVIRGMQAADKAAEKWKETSRAAKSAYAMLDDALSRKEITPELADALKQDPTLSPKSVTDLLAPMRKSKSEEQTRADKLEEIRRQQANEDRKYGLDWQKFLHAKSSEKGSGGKTIPAGDVEQLAELPAAISLLDDLAKSHSALNMSGKTRQAEDWLADKGLMTRDSEIAKYRAEAQRAMQGAGMIMEGGKLQAGDETKYRTMLPQPGDSEELALQKVTDLKKFLRSKVRMRLDALKAAGYDVNPNLYGALGEVTNATTPEPKAPPTTPPPPATKGQSPLVWVKLSNGQKGQISRSKLKEFLKDNPGSEEVK